MSSQQEEEKRKRQIKVPPRFKSGLNSLLSAKKLQNAKAVLLKKAKRDAIKKVHPKKGQQNENPGSTVVKEIFSMKDSIVEIKKSMFCFCIKTFIIRTWVIRASSIKFFICSFFLSLIKYFI